MFLSLSLYMQYSCHLIIFITRLSPVPQSLSRAGESKTEHRTSGMTSAVLRPAGNTPPATQDTVGHLYPMGTLLAYIQLLVGTVRFTAVFYLVSSQHILVHALLTTGLHPLPHHMSPHLSHYLVSPSSFCSCIDLPPPIHSQPPYSAHVSTVCIFSQISFFLFLNS